MAIDPGEHIGIVFEDGLLIKGITLEGDERNKHLWDFLMEVCPDRIAYEQFALRQSSASKLIGNKFITCEVIGVIKLYCQLTNTPITELLPSNKEYCGFSSNPKDPKYRNIIMLYDQKITEHVRDAYRLYSYYKLFTMKSK